MHMSRFGALVVQAENGRRLLAATKKFGWAAS
jgi:hypothetical protein